MKITEIYQSIQGEGVHIGEPQIFVRLYGCNLRCRWCDTKFSIGTTSDDCKEMTVKQVFAEISRSTCKAVCITGGEPLVQKAELNDLLVILRAFNYYVQICTNGTLWEGEIFELCDFISMDMKAPSSGMESELALIGWLESSRPKNSFEIKVVIQDTKDFIFAMDKVRPAFEGVLILQPEGGVKLRELTDLCLNLNIKNFRVLPQLHKLIWGLARKR